jgi:hypothetical protein
MSARDDYAVHLLREQEERLQHEASEAEDRANAAWKRHQGIVANLESVRAALFALGADPDEVTEASETNPSKATALSNLRAQVEKEETAGVIQMYENAAFSAGATVAEIEKALKR